MHIYQDIDEGHGGHGYPKEAKGEWVENIKIRASGK